MNQQTAFITGASEGIGRVFAKELAKQGFRITAVARNAQRLQSLLGELPGEGHKSLQADLCTPAGIGRAVDSLKQDPPSLLINNAGFGVYGKFTEQTFENYRNLLRLNIEALTELSYTFLSGAKKGDALINVSSVLAFLPMAAGQVYAASKAYVTSFSEALWQQYRDDGIYVMGLCPGATRTNFHKRAGGSEKNAPPSAATQTPEQVVQIALNHLAARSSPTVVCGLGNKATTSLTRLIPRKTLVGLIGKAFHFREQ